MHRPLRGILAAAALLACQPTPRSDPAAARRAIDSLNARAEQWYAAGQIDSLVQNFAQDVWQMPPNRAPLVGRDSLRNFWVNLVQAGRVSFDFEVADVITADSIAVERGRYTLRFTARAQAPMRSFEDEGNYVALWRRESDGRWRIVWDAPVSVRPASGPPTSPSPNQ